MYMLIRVRMLATLKKNHTHTKQMLNVTLNLKAMLITVHSCQGHFLLFLEAKPPEC